MGHDLAIIVMQNLFFIGSYGIDMEVIHLLALFEHRCCMHYLNMNVICLLILFRHECCLSICIVYTWKSCTWLMCLNNAWHSSLNDMNPWNNRFCTNLERNYEVFYARLVQGRISLSTPSLKCLLMPIVCFLGMQRKSWR
jgi:hypothetical protein